MEIKLDFKKADLKGATRIVTSTLASKTHFANFKTKQDHLDADKFKNFPTDLSKLSNLVDNDAVKKPVDDKWVTKVNAIDAKITSTSALVTKRLKVLKKRYLTLVNWLERLITTRKLQRPS